MFVNYFLMFYIKFYILNIKTRTRIVFPIHSNFGFDKQGIKVNFSLFYAKSKVIICKQSFF